MVQTREQYEFIYRALYLVFEKLFEEYAKKKKNGGRRTNSRIGLFCLK